MSEKILHIYGQRSFHADAFIVSNKAGLLALKEAIDKTLSCGKASVEVYVTDGEGYDLGIICNDDDWSSDFWRKLAVPYSEDYAKESRKDAIWPWQIWHKEIRKDDGK